MNRSAYMAVCAFTLWVWGSTNAYAQVATGSIAGTVMDTSGAVMPGVTVSLSGERLIGGTQTVVTDSRGRYRFDRLPPGSYNLEFELQGFKTVRRERIRINAAFTATVDAELEVGAIEESITVTAESPTVDTKSTLQQTVLSQELLEGVPTGRNPWAGAQVIPGVAVANYDVGGQNSIQSTRISVHGSSTSDAVYAVDGLDTNWPGGDGGTVAYYYDQGMMEEVSYQTSAIPAESAVGGVFINMVTKQGSNRLSGHVRTYYGNEDLQWENHNTDELEQYGFGGGNPVDRVYDFNATAGGPFIEDRLWWFVAYRRWAFDAVNLGAFNADGTPAINDNMIYNGSGKLTWSPATRHTLSVLFNYNDKIRHHRRDAPPAYMPDRATTRHHLWTTQPLIQYAAVIGENAVFESRLSNRASDNWWGYQDEVALTDIRIEDQTRSTADVAGPKELSRPNSKMQFNNVLTLTTTDHTIKSGVQYTAMDFEDYQNVRMGMHRILQDGIPTSIRIYNTPTTAISYERQIGFFVQDTWLISSRLTLNLGARYDRLRGWWPDHDVPAGPFVPARQLDERTVIRQNLGVWRLGAIYDLFGDGKTALKANHSRYGRQVGINRINDIHPFSISSGSRSWTDRNGDLMPQENELGRFSGFPEASRRYADPENGPEWPYSDEITVGIEREVAEDLRIGVTYYHRTNRKDVGSRNVAVPPTAYTEHTVTVPGTPQGPGGTATFYDLDPSFFGLQDNVLDNEPLLDTNYNGVEFTVNKRFSEGWQIMAGLTLGKNEGGVSRGDFNDPNNLNNQQGIVGYDQRYSFRLAGSYLAPWDLELSGTMLYEDGYPFNPTYIIRRTVYPELTRPSQTSYLTEPGTERLPAVLLAGIRFSRPIKLGKGHQLTPQLEIFNLTNGSSITGRVASVGSRYEYPTSILPPRLVRFGFEYRF